jgi:excisionase family DNA binding protein
VRQLGPSTDTRDVADKLNAAGLTTGHGRAFDVAAVQWIRHAYHIPAPTPYAHGKISVAEAAQRLGCSNGVVYDWIKTGKLVARRGSGKRLCLPWTKHIEVDCRQHTASATRHGCRRGRAGTAARRQDGSHACLDQSKRERRDVAHRNAHAFRAVAARRRQSCRFVGEDVCPSLPRPNQLRRGTPRSGIAPIGFTWL